MDISVQYPKVSLKNPRFHGEQRLRVALVGLPKSGKSTIFKAVSSTAFAHGELQASQASYHESLVRIGFDEASVIDLPALQTLKCTDQTSLDTLQFLLWGNHPPAIAAHEAHSPPAPYAEPDVIIQVVDASSLERHLELTLELSMLGRPLVLALNMTDQADAKGLHISSRVLSRQLGVPVISTVAHMGQGIAQLFECAADAVREKVCPIPQPASRHICEALKPLSKHLNKPALHEAFKLPHEFLLTQVAMGDPYFSDEIRQHFPELSAEIDRLCEAADMQLPRGLQNELHADRHHRAASIFESATRFGAPHQGSGLQYWLDELFLHPHWGLLGSLFVFALVLFMVFEVSAWLDSMTAARLVEWISAWQPVGTGAVIARAVVDGLIGLVGIVVPYMLPLVLLLVALEDSGIMHRIAFVMDKGFHRLGLHGGVAASFLLGLGCNVPAISTVSRVSSSRERVVASLLITFVPCSARSAVILALAGKYLGGFGVFSIFMLTILVIALLGPILSRRFAEQGPGQVQEIPPYSLPSWPAVMHDTWLRTRDILTIVTPLLVGGSVVLALLNHFGADDVINAVLSPITVWWLGLPVVLGVPLLFGILRKELSLLMIYQAFGSFDIAAHLNWAQLTTLLVFLTFYIPCVSTFAVLIKTIKLKYALYSLALSMAIALIISGVLRVLLGLAQQLM